jgi:hypothetical protein
MQNGTQIVAKGSANYVYDGQTIITIQGQPNDFSIDLTMEKKKPRMRLPIMLQTMLGGGILILQEQREEEQRAEFSKDFWDYVGKIISRLSGTTGIPTEKTDT